MTFADMNVVFIDPSVSDADMLIATLPTVVPVVTLDAGSSGLKQIADYLIRHPGMRNLHIVSHGEPGALLLGDTWVGIDALYANRQNLDLIRTSLVPHAEFFLYGCRIAEGDIGRSFVSTLARLTHTKVAASTTLTGSPVLGGDWELQYQSAPIMGKALFSGARVSGYPGVLAAPTLSSPVPDQVATQGKKFTFSIPVGTFLDTDDIDRTRLKLNVTLEDDTALPDWLKFDGKNNTLKGTPKNGDVDQLRLKLLATDTGGETVSDPFLLTVLNINDAPTISISSEESILDQNIKEGEGWSLNVKKGLPISVQDIDPGDQENLVYFITSNDGKKSLPAWLSYNQATTTLSGKPGNDDVDDVKLKLTVRDPWGASDSQTFKLTVQNVNDAPELSRPVPDQMVTQDQKFRFTIPADTFSDIDKKDRLTLSLTNDAEGEAALPVWLSYDQATTTLSGKPGNDDVGDVKLKLTAQDPWGASDSQTFKLTVQNVNDAPELSRPVPDQMVTQDQKFRFTIPADTFSDIDKKDRLTLSLTNDAEGEAALPVWLKFDGKNTLSGTPGNTDVGQLSLKLVATDTEGKATSDTFILSVKNANDAPEFSDIPLELDFSIAEDSGNPVENKKSNSIFISDLLKESSYSDQDSDTKDPSIGVRKGIALVNLPQKATGWYTLDDGKSWQEIPKNVAENRALVLNEESRLYFVPDQNHDGDLTFRVRGWDQTYGESGKVINIIGKGGKTAFSDQVLDVTFTVTNTPDAPTLEPLSNIPFDITVTGKAALESNQWLTVKQLLATVPVSDGDQEGSEDQNAMDNMRFKLEAVNNIGVNTWKYRTEGSGSWLDLKGDEILNPSDRLAFMIDNAADYTKAATLTFKALDSLENLTSINSATLATTTKLSGVGNITGTGFNDEITGSSGQDTLDGLAGRDTLKGGDGDDLYRVNSLGDRVIENKDDGMDSIESDITYQLPNNVENLVLTGDQQIDAIGNGMNNTITGNAASNRLFGKGGNDTFVITTAKGGGIPDSSVDIIIDFQKGDRIKLSNFSGEDRAKLSYNDQTDTIYYAPSAELLPLVKVLGFTDQDMNTLQFGV